MRQQYRSYQHTDHRLHSNRTTDNLIPQKKISAVIVDNQHDYEQVISLLKNYQLDAVVLDYQRLQLCFFSQKSPPHRLTSRHQALTNFLIAQLIALPSNTSLPTSNNAPGINRIEHLVQRTCQYLLAHLEQRLTLVLVSAAMHTNRNRLAQAFRQQLNMGVSAWLRLQRLHKAYRLLSEGKLSIQEIAERVGYPSQGNFSTAFKRQFQQTPQQVKRQSETTNGNARIGDI